MAADIVTLAQAIVDEFEAWDWGQPKTVVRAWLDVKEPKDVATLRVTVFPESQTDSFLDRQRDASELRLVVEAMKRIDSHGNAEIDPLVDAVAAARAHVSRGRPSGYPNAIAMPGEWPIVCSPEHLQQNRVFWSVFVLSYRSPA